ncbi:MAG TPA: M4 family metallopeptidase [Anaerolineae bacterium]|nr:M4 family metallopeptidase [Anaerolineae bacterium]
MSKVRLNYSFAAIIALLVMAMVALTPRQAAAAGSQAPTSNERTVLADDGQEALISYDASTGVARFLRFPNNGSVSMAAAPNTAEAQVDAFLAEYGDLFGITNPAAQLEELSVWTDAVGDTHFEYRQVYNGVDVFAGLFFVHVDENNSIKSANGVFVPDLSVNTTPRLSAEEAGAVAELAVNGQVSSFDAVSILANSAPAAATDAKLYVYRDGLLRGIVGTNHLVYEFLVTNGADVREYVYVDAHKGAIINRIDMLHSIDRTIYNQTIDPGNILWQEGDPLPYVGATVTETESVNMLVDASGDMYDAFVNAFGFTSWDGADGAMLVTYDNPSISCPNANWNGTSINFCPGTSTDDVIAHEWGHAYTDSTHNLIYQWQSGALNESYSDIWGETIDQINGRGTDAPNDLRTDVCTLGGSTPPSLVVNSPAVIAGELVIGGANFNPVVGPVTADVVLVDDGTDATTDGCEALVNGADVSGNIALIDRGSCAFVVKVLNAQAAGAVGVLIANNVSPGTITMGGSGDGINIPSVMVSLEDGQAIRDNAPANVTITLGEPGTDDSIRWLMGEDSWAFGGAIRDMWNPTCMGDPGKVTDVNQYVCSTSDGGGVHTNSGVPNHTYALLVDGGTYNGQTIDAIGWVKAAHIYWRAADVYQGPASNFIDHADALEASCNDLIGMALNDFDGNVFAETIDAADCAAVGAAVAATELRTPPDFCNFQPLLDPNTPPICADETAMPVWAEYFDVDPSWAVTHTLVYGGTPMDWQWMDTLPAGRTGGLYGEDPTYGSCTEGPGDESRIMLVHSPEITIPALGAGESLLISIDHYVATELGYDGGNVWYSVNGGDLTLVPPEAFVFNPYNAPFADSSTNTSPLAGLPGFHGTDGGSLSGSWGTSQVDASGLGTEGDTVVLTFAMANDGCAGFDGWYIDSIEVYACAAPDPDIDVNPTTLSSTQMRDTTTTHDVDISNLGDNMLDWWMFDGRVFDSVPPSFASYIMSSYYAGPSAGIYSSDDVSVMYDTTVWNIHVNGWDRGANLANATALTWYIYPDNGGEPAGVPNSGDGMEIWTHSSALDGAGVTVSGADVSLDLAAAGASLPVLTGGNSYWIVLFADVPGTAGAANPDQWGVLDGIEQGYPAKLIDPADLLGGGYTTWSNIGIDLSMSIEGTTAECPHPGEYNSWVDISMTGGMIGVGAAPDTVTFGLDSTGLAPATYTTIACVMSNDPDEMVTPINIEMIVTVPTDVSLASVAGDTASNAMPVGVVVLVFTMLLGATAVLVRRQRSNA